MEESKELQSYYKIFRTLIYVSLVMEFFVYAFAPEAIAELGSVVYDIWLRIKRWVVYADGHIIYSKLMTFLIIVVTCVGTKNKKNLDFNAKTMVLYPFVGGVLTLVMAVMAFWLSDQIVFDGHMVGWMMAFYLLFSVVGTVLIHVACDNIWKHLKEGLMKDRFNFENESFQQMEKLDYNDYSVNIPMKYYYKKKFRDGFVNISNPFRGTGRTEGVIFVRLTHWLKLNVNHLKSVIWAEQKKKYQKIRKGMTSGRLGTWLGNRLFYFPKFPKKTALLDVLNLTILFPTVG